MNHISTSNLRRPFIKVCGLTYAGSVDCAAAYGAEYVGFNFCQGSEYYVSPAHAASMQSANVMRVGVFNGGDAAAICRTMQRAGLHLAQLQESGSVADACAIGPQRVIRVLRAGAGCTPLQLQRMLDSWAPYCRAFLIESADAALLASAAFPRPWILSGRIALHTLCELLRTCRPDGVDIESSLDCSETMAVMRSVS
ncbi:MAG: hypothetical protein IKA55_01285 [Akkermansia sp.]|nr:hypothetical protein [Akkermansia sp.]